MAAVAELLANISRTSSSLPHVPASTDVAQDPPSPPTPPIAKADESAPEDCDLPVCPRMVIPDDYTKEDKGEEGGGVDHPPAPGRLDHTSTHDPSFSGRTKRPLSADVSHDLDKPTLLVPSPRGTTAAVVDYDYYYNPEGIAVCQDQDSVSGHIISIVSLSGCGREGGGLMVEVGTNILG